jgi:hypothetical protein
MKTALKSLPTVVYNNMVGLRNGTLIGTRGQLMREFRDSIRTSVHNHLPTPVSQNVKEMLGVECIPYYNWPPKRGKGIYLNHIVDVKDLAKKYIDMALNPNIPLILDEIQHMLISDYLAVYCEVKLGSDDARKHLSK